MITTGVDQFELAGSDSLVAQILSSWDADGSARRLWARDPTLWFPQPTPEITDRLGWLDLPHQMSERVAELEDFSREVPNAGIQDAVVLGMGGSSLAPALFASMFPAKEGHPRLHVLDSTHPGSVVGITKIIDPSRSLFLVSSKSGTTIEPLSFYRYFRKLVERTSPNAGGQFVAITDPGTPLEKLARSSGFRSVFSGPPEVGGRYSALSVFGLVPAALLGVDLVQLLASAEAMAKLCLPGSPAAENPGLRLGAALGALYQLGRDKITLLADPSAVGLPGWIEQLIAESTGKDGRGLVPVTGEPIRNADSYGTDRALVRLGGRAQGREAELLGQIAKAGVPLLSLCWDNLTEVGGEFFRWEVAISMAGRVLGIHPFNQPDVQLAKDLAQRAMAANSDPGRNAELLNPASSDELRTWTRTVHPGDYVVIQAFIQDSAATESELRSLQENLFQHLSVPVTVQFGPRFLHSTGQLHKGGPPTGRFVQLIDEPDSPVPVPETDYSFGRLIRAQAVGDAQALQSRGRPVLRSNLGRNAAAGIGRLRHTFDSALIRPN